ncbi:hypothetical protein [Flavobacterium crassostreae]|uniref:Uncharacterized protein n=1 Tax=Flavobacterium crassostreae TaxID=1763534 RepID=A0A1B9E7N4_9FLAO|nr:hypothetical protein [Flavobacterium crassostreae]OCB77956.1 hypothetical protein LPBF_03140 [Flavobacterium crassostreae]
MYSEQSIEVISKRIGWGKPQVDGFTINLVEAIENGTSKRNFQSFHQLVTIENVLAAVPDPNILDEEFNAKLAEIRDNATRAVLTLVIDLNPNSDLETDYSNSIITNSVLFDDAVGYKVAMSVLELFISTERKNFSERSAQMAISALKLEIEGWKNELGITVANGLGQKLNKAVKMASNRLFPTNPTVNNGKTW